MDFAALYPKGHRRAIKRLVSAVGMSVETAYAMMVMTAALMDLDPADDKVIDMILSDCGIFPERIDD